MKINFYSIFPFLSSLFILFLSFFVYVKQRTSPLNRAFSRFSFFTFIWLFSYGISYSTTTEQQAFFWLRIGYTGVIMLPATYYHFISTFLNLRFHNKILIFLYGISFLFIYSLYNTDYFVNGLYKYSWGYYPKVGFLHPIYLFFLFFIACSCYVLFLINWLKIKKEVSLYKKRLAYISLAFIICSFASVDFIPNYGIEIYPFGWIFAVFYSSIIAYAILRYRIMDIYIYIRRTVAYSFAAGLLTAFFVVIVLTMTKYLSNKANVSSFSITVVAAMIIALLFNPLRNRIQMLIDKLFYKKSYDYYETIQKVSHELATKFNIREIYNFVGDTIHSTLGLRNIYLLYASVGGYYRVVYQKAPKGDTERKNGADSQANVKRAKIDEKSELVKYLNNTKNIAIKELLDDIEQERFEEIKNSLEPFKGEVIVPVFVDDNLSHLMILGRKVSGDMFTNEDIRLLETISNQTAIAIKQAQLYAEKVMSEKLASIGMMSATFAHEIRNPLTSLKTFAQLMPEKYNDAEFREVFPKIVSFDIERIDSLIKDLLDFSSRKRYVGVDNFNLIELMDETINYVKNKFGLEKKNITVERNYKNVEVNMTGDINRLKQAFINIMSNGCQAMQGGGVLTVDITPDNENVNISITDTGEGIAPEDIDRIFEPFYTTKEFGVGLGLAISKQAIEDHGGKIKVESKLAHGTTFIITLPLTTN